MTPSKEPGIVLRVTPLRETDLLVRILTQHRGKISAVAKGARRSKRRFMGGLDIFDCGVFECATPKRDDSLLALNGLDGREMWLNLRQDFTRLTLASLCLEITDDFAPEADRDGSKLFGPLYLCLRNIDREDSPWLQSAAVVYYLLVALRCAGLDPLADEQRHNLEIDSWLTDMLSRRVAYVPAQRELLRDALSLLLSQTEHALGRTIRTRKEVMIRVQHLLSAA